MGVAERICDAHFEGGSVDMKGESLLGCDSMSEVAVLFAGARRAMKSMWETAGSARRVFTMWDP